MGAGHAMSMTEAPAREEDGLPQAMVWVLSLLAPLSTLISFGTIWSQLYNYRMVHLQRHVVRILFLVPLFTIASYVSLMSLDTAFFIDAVRDVYEAFTIVSFFTLLVNYLGGDRNILAKNRGREPVAHPWPMNYLLKPWDLSDEARWLMLKRALLQYVYVKPTIAIVTVVLKLRGAYSDGRLSWSNGYTYMVFIDNASICVTLYCLAYFWVAMARDLASFRPVMKFFCIKGIVFFSFWQGTAISIACSLGLITRFFSVPRDSISIAISDTLIELEMPFFALLHAYAFSSVDYMDRNLHMAKLPVWYAIRDAAGLRDLVHENNAIRPRRRKPAAQGSPAQTSAAQPSAAQPSGASAIPAPVPVPEREPLLASEPAMSDISIDYMSVSSIEFAPDTEDDQLYEEARHAGGAVNYPVLDISQQDREWWQFVDRWFKPWVSLDFARAPSAPASTQASPV